MNISVVKIKTNQEKELAFKIRNQVFVIEQQVDASEEYDDEDELSTHFLAFLNDEPCGTARWRFKEKGIIKLERFAVLESYRGKGIGEALVKAVLNDVPLANKVMMHAQLHALPFYEKQGFEAYGPQFAEAGIEHFAMKLT
ncbi:MAG: GNAT family N-acetyltransferase [Bacteroidetes bacterium]|nr:GNAT family N-acetyltransferase [Bacteroidota bacterium]